MKVSKTARQKLKNYTRYLGYTLGIYREAFAWINQVVYDQWASIEKCLSSKERVNLIERLIHSTSKNKAPFSQFDQRFYKFPSYFRRMVIMESIGHVSSHLTRFNQWKANPKGKEPAFQPNCQSFPVFYKKNMSEWMRNGKIRLKLYTGTDWIWFVLPFNPVNMERFPALERWVRKNPMLVQKGKKWLIHIPFEKEVSLTKKNFNRPVLSVDLGISKTAVCSVVCSDGTVTHREFISFVGEKDLLDTTLGKLAKAARQTGPLPEGSDFGKTRWQYVRHLTDEISHQCSHQIVSLAKDYHCQTIVFEHLGKLKLPIGCFGAKRLRRKFHYFLRGRIQKYTQYKANGEGLRISRVLARGTSQYAFDGSGEVVRSGNRQMALFQTGKIYHSDLSASYNIGARYWIRELFNPKTQVGNNLVVKLGENPVLTARHQQTLASLISLGQYFSQREGSSPPPYSSQGFSQKETATIASA